MKTTKIILTIAAAALLLGLFSGCGAKSGDQSQEPKKTGENSSAGGETVTLKGIADIVPHSEIIEFVTPKLAEKGVKIELVSTSSDNTTNEKLAKGEIDFNYFQHNPYLQEWTGTNGYDLINAGNIHVEPITAYSDRYAGTNEVPDNAVVAIPNDGTNEYRALRILEQNGFIKLNEETATSLSASVSDIKEYLRPIKIVELDAFQIIPTKDDYDFFITNTNKALEAKITSKKLFSEDSDSPYANIIAVRGEDKDNPAILALVAELQSDETRTFITEKYNGAVIPTKLK